MAPDNSNDYLLSQEGEWQRAKFSIHRYCAYETQKFKCLLVVDETSGTRLCEHSVALNKNHANIVKPTPCQRGIQSPYAASAANASGFLLVSLSKMPRLGLHPRPHALRRRISDQG